VYEIGGRLAVCARPEAAALLVAFVKVDLGRVLDDQNVPVSALSDGARCKIFRDRIDVHVRRIEEIPDPLLPGAGFPQFTHNDGPLAGYGLDNLFRPSLNPDVAISHDQAPNHHSESLNHIRVRGRIIFGNS
jgi:hypothetical protein